ncbi:MAG: bifunctional 4-hydroxy-2-oxoglutarate aldolase/2-dehydro-3-deoxy-phosphogluconate aldolase [Bacteroidota bacterium]
MQDVLKTIEAYPLVPVFYHDDITTCIDTIDSCYKGGVRVFEFVKRGGNAHKNFEALVDHRNQAWPDLKLGIGTIKTQQEAQDFLALKADFIVSPIVNPPVGQVTLANNTCWIPGAMTPTEIALAAQVGAQFIKLFPGDVLGPQFVKAVKAVFPELKFMVTGGVLMQQDNLHSWFKAGVNAVGAGSNLFQQPDYNALQHNVATALNWIKEV